MGDKDRELKKKNRCCSMYHHFERFVQPGMLGFYRSASVVSIILHEKEHKVFHNLYTLVTMQEFPGRKIDVLRHGTSKTLHLDKKRSVMILFQDVTIDTAKSLYRSVSETGIWQPPGSSSRLMVEELRVLPPLFVPIYPKPPFHHGLKNPDRGCHYLLELFAEKKRLASTLTEREKRKIAHWVMQTVPIDLQLLSDRWGNIVFQFPVTLFTVQSRGDGRGTHLHVHLSWHPKIASRPPELNVEASVNHDGLILGYGASEGTKSDHEIGVGSMSGQITMRIKRKMDNFLLFEKTNSLMHQIVLDLHLSFQEEREVIVPAKNKDDPEEHYRVRLEHVQKPGVIGKKQEWKEWVGKRQHQESVKQLEERKFFVQYFSINQKEERKRAIADLRNLIETYGGNGVYLWDPYCDGIDILNTLFACRVYGAPLKVITSFPKKVKKSMCDGLHSKDHSLQHWKEHFAEQLKKGGNFLGVNLEVRFQYGNKGWPFHDRFLLFPGEPPHVWSLGTSINSIGTSHSILLKVEHAQPVIDAFDDLWEKLEGNVVWPLKNGI